ncbi:hypothetical protein [Corynebacterium aquatimens]|uniref:Cell wall anchor protein n=1 Tax=Corynebacterium aquatimens TaxID=1190508 RepID=A0A931GU60_9CORY|nr:hypothetical protein [Corynebacterium aquatimens]MBG6122445.1 hypothetical protein [Corynebacterium aquatimens]WJY65015.1 hypothetical protein CAQUA_01380 [Corynebacterium aquatimens]
MTTKHTGSAANATGGHTETASTFDIRNVIGYLLGFYGAVLIICGFILDPGVNPDTGVAKSSQDNLWVGIALAVAALFFIVWAKLNPITFDADTLEAE